jgi:hypothetical protein
LPVDNFNSSVVDIDVVEEEQGHFYLPNTYEIWTIE